MESGETAGHGNGRRDVQTARKRSAQARSWKPGRRRQPSGARERWKPEGARRRRRLDAKHDSATGHVSGRGRPFNQRWTYRLDARMKCYWFARVSASAQPGNGIEQCQAQRPSWGQGIGTERSRKSASARRKSAEWSPHGHCAVIACNG